MIKRAKYAYCLYYTEMGGGVSSFRRAFLITTIICWNVSLNNGDSNARVTAPDINGTSGRADSVRRYAHAPEVTGTKYMFMRQDVCVRKSDSSEQHAFLPMWLLIFSPERARAALKAVRWLKKKPNPPLPNKFNFPDWGWRDLSPSVTLTLTAVPGVSRVPCARESGDRSDVLGDLTQINSEACVP